MIDFKRFRKDKRLTQEALANMLGMDQSRIYRMEKNGDGFTPEHMDILCSRYADIDDYVIDDSNVAPRSHGFRIAGFGSFPAAHHREPFRNHKKPNFKELILWTSKTTSPTLLARRSRAYKSRKRDSIQTQ